jgi:hypothetical protein
LWLLRYHGERPRHFQQGKDADQPLVDPIALGNLPGEILLPRSLTQVLVGAAGGRRHLHRVLLEARSLREQERLQAPPVHALGLEEFGHRTAAHDRQIAAEQHSIEAGQRSLDHVAVLADELVHPPIERSTGSLGKPLLVSLGKLTAATSHSPLVAAEGPPWGG